MTRTKIAILQLSTTVGSTEANTTHARALLSHLEPNTISLLLLPELALTGYNFTSLTHIRPHLEPTHTGPSFRFAAEQAQRLNCVVIIGYPEQSAQPLPHATFPDDAPLPPIDPEDPSPRYNTVVAVRPDGSVQSAYRKHFLYYTDTPWATRGPSFASGAGVLALGAASVPYAHGICMDLNPFDFHPHRWADFEFARHVLADPAAPRLLLLSNAWNLAAPGAGGETEAEMVAWEESVEGAAGAVPSRETLAYWVERLAPLVRDGRERVVVVANHCGREGMARYAGSSCVLRVGGARVAVLAVMGVREEGVLVVDVDL